MLSEHTLLLPPVQKAHAQCRQCTLRQATLMCTKATMTLPKKAKKLRSEREHPTQNLTFLVPSESSGNRLLDAQLC